MGPTKNRVTKNKVGVGRNKGRLTLGHIDVNEAES